VISAIEIPRPMVEGPAGVVLLTEVRWARAESRFLRQIWSNFYALLESEQDSVQCNVNGRSAPVRPFLATLG